jgi:hypothetical protein
VESRWRSGPQISLTDALELKIGRASEEGTIYFRLAMR